MFLEAPPTGAYRGKLQQSFGRAIETKNGVTFGYTQSAVQVQVENPKKSLRQKLNPGVQNTPKTHF